MCVVWPVIAGAAYRPETQPNHQSGGGELGLVGSVPGIEQVMRTAEQLIQSVCRGLRCCCGFCGAGRSTGGGASYSDIAALLDGGLTRSFLGGALGAVVGG